MIKLNRIDYNITMKGRQCQGNPTTVLMGIFGHFDLALLRNPGW